MVSKIKKLVKDKYAESVDKKSTIVDENVRGLGKGVSLPQAVQLKFFFNNKKVK